jgi:hypothetical protein
MVWCLVKNNLIVYVMAFIFVCAAIYVHKDTSKKDKCMHEGGVWVDTGKGHNCMNEVFEMKEIKQ